MITIQEAQRRIDLNTAEWKTQEATGVFIPTSYYWFDATPSDLSFPEIQGKAEDLTSALATGVLPILRKKNGADAYKISNNTFVPVELKSTWVSFLNMWKSVNGTLYTGTKNEKNKRSAVKSSHEAAYSVRQDKIYTKKMETHLVLFYAKPGSHFPIVIEARCVTDVQIVAMLTSKMDKKEATAKSEGKQWLPTVSQSIQIKFIEFEATGIRSDISGIGYDLWEDQIRLLVPVLDKEAEDQAMVDKIKQKDEAFLTTPEGIHSMQFFGWSTVQSNEPQEQYSLA